MAHDNQRATTLISPARSIFVIHPSDELTDHLPSGDGQIAFGFITQLAARGHNIHVATPSASILGTLPNNIVVHCIDERPLDGYLSRIRYAIKVRRLYERLKRSVNFDLVQQMNPVTAGLSLGMIGVKPPLFLGTFVPRWPHDAHHSSPTPISLKVRLADLALSVISFTQIIFATALLVTSPAATSRLPLSRLFRSRTYEVHHGIDTSYFCPSTLQLNSQSNQVLFLGSLWVRKGILTLIEAFEKVYQANPQAMLIIAGGGEIEAQVRDKLEQLSCSRNVTLLGAVSRVDVPDLMRAATVCCAPGFNEPYSTALIEAMACGSAVVITDTGGVPHMVPTLGGRCVTTRDVNSLAAALIELLTQPDLTKRMGKVNREFAIEQYSWHRVIDRLEAVYESVLSGRITSRRIASSKETFGARRKDPPERC